MGVLIENWAANPWENLGIVSQVARISRGRSDSGVGWIFFSPMPADGCWQDSHGSFDEWWLVTDRCSNTQARHLVASRRLSGRKATAPELRMRMRKQGTRPNQVQLEQMIQGLSVRDLGHRAMSDWLLRQFVANAPPYDPTWTGVTLQRGIAIYRDRAGLPKNRTRPSAAARQ